MGGVEIGIDTGGTFTDVVCRAGNDVRLMKIPSSRGDPSAAVREALGRMILEWGVDPAAVARFAHGTTVATNAVLERTGARAGLLTTEGFRDVLEIGRQLRRQMYDLKLRPETPVFLAPGARRAEVQERVSATGEVLVPLDEASLARAVEKLADEGVQAIAVCFLFSFLYPAHEERARDFIARRYSEIAVSLSSEVDPAFREYERTCATTFDAYVKPVVDRYLGRMEQNLAERGIQAPLQIMQSRGGLAAASVARRRPVRLFLSGPAAGVIGGRAAGQASGIQDIITVDVGGTSSDIALIAGGDAVVRSEGEINGYAVRVPMVDVNTLGAGGGSIAWLDPAGGLRVGPHSAGAEPGPVCYGRGGEDPTVTDASLVLGYLDPDYFAGSSLRLDRARAEAAIAEKIARPMALTIDEAALGIHRIVNAQMAEGIRLVSIKRGLDPRGFTLVPLGGAGPLHAAALAADLGMERVLVPRHPGVLSAAGLLAAPVEHEVATAFPRKLAQLDLGEARIVLAELDARAERLMQAERIAAADVSCQHFADICYVGQSYPLEVSLDLVADDPSSRLYDDFLAAHERVHGHSMRAPAQIVALRTVHRSVVGSPVIAAGTEDAAMSTAVRQRDIRIVGVDERVRASVYRRESLRQNETLAGPAIVEQSDTTVLIPPGWQGRVVEAGNLLLERSKE